ncbi:hypothetical protein [Listeria ivanovii]|uniref:hypothetical protein n=1 Tax=Listeria ivanovii TaxID=1638 RepID=UPI001941B160|nr:hypothetical protein [Listeria ivanovii]MBM5707766.1 hypothetical protein [Listeria ivanovii]
MSSKLIDKLEALQALEEHWCKHSGATTEYASGYIHGLGEAIGIAEQHEVEQMKEPFYQLDQKEETQLNMLKKEFLRLKSLYGRAPFDGDIRGLIFMHSCGVSVIHAFKTWAIKQEKMEEEDQCRE